MSDLNFYSIDFDYVEYLQKAEASVRGRSRVPNMNYGSNRMQKFTCGIVLQVNGFDYYVPVSSYKIQQPDNFLIQEKNGRVTSSLRFNYMFPVPASMVAPVSIDGIPDQRYKALVAQELRYCIKNQDEIRKRAERTYRRVSLGFNRGLVENSCDFALLEAACTVYGQQVETAAPV